jgi:hypothetical protein
MGLVLDARGRIFDNILCAMHTLDKAKHIHKKRECYTRTMTARVQLKKKKILVMSLKGFGAKMK